MTHSHFTYFIRRHHFYAVRMAVTKSLGGRGCTPDPDGLQCTLYSQDCYTVVGKGRDFTCNSKADKISLVYHTNQTKKMKRAKQKKDEQLSPEIGNKNP